MASKYAVVDIMGSIPLLGKWREWLDWLNGMISLQWWNSAAGGRQEKEAQKE